MLISILMGLSAFSQEIILMNSSTNDSTIILTGCSALLYDSGGPDGNYSNNENYMVTICVPSGYPMEINVTMNTEGPIFDYLYIYEGTSTSGTPIASRIGGSSYTNQYTLNSSCATFVWHSDGSVCSYRGFEIEIRCSHPCQNYTVAIVSDAQYDENDSVYFGCTGTTFSAQIDFLHNNENYEQTIENTTFSWHVLGNNRMHSYEGLGLNEFPDSLAPGAYIVSLTTIDANHCMVVAEDVSFNISVPPSFAGTTASSDVPLGTEVSLIGVVNPIDAWPEMPVVYNFDQICLADITNLDCTISLYVTSFAPSQTIQSASDIESICMDMEHSYIGDIEMWISCPSGNSMYLFNGGSCPDCSWEFFGEPVDEGNDACVPGVPYHYCWTNDASLTIEDVASDPPSYTYTNTVGYTYTDHQYIPGGEYLPIGDWTNLIGCPLNGEWRINVRDHLGSDDGIVFQTELHFSGNITPAIGFQNTYGNEMWWEGEALQYEGMGANNIAIPTTIGLFEYTFSATDNFGCTYDTTLYVNVLPVSDIDEISDDDILVFPNPVNDMLTITSSEAISEIEIVNDKGQIVRRMDVNGNTAACNVSELASGVYVVKIRSFESSTGLGSEAQGAEIQRKFIKE